VAIVGLTRLQPFRWRNKTTIFRTYFAATAKTGQVDAQVINVASLTVGTAKKPGEPKPQKSGRTLADLSVF